MNEKTRQWYERSSQVLERSIEIDRASNASSLAMETKLGKTNVHDIGNNEIYMYLGMAYERLGRNEKALEAFKYMRHIGPMDPAAYMRIASVQVALGKLEDAAVTLMQALIADPDRKEAWQFLDQIYAEINHETIPAVQVRDGLPQLREDNALVRRHLFSAYAGFMQILKLAERPETAQQARDVAINHYHFDARQLDEIAGEGKRPVPPTPVFHSPGKKLSEESLQR